MIACTLHPRFMPSFIIPLLSISLYVYYSSLFTLFIRFYCHACTLRKTTHLSCVSILISAFFTFYFLACSMLLLVDPTSDHLHYFVNLSFLVSIRFSLFFFSLLLLLFYIYSVIHITWNLDTMI